MSGKESHNSSSFEATKVWQDAIELAVIIYKLTEDYPSSEQFGLISQLRRAAVSISTNFAEGFGRTSRNDKKHFYVIAYGSLLEVKSLLYLSQKLGFLDNLEKLEAHIKDIQIQINAVRKSLN